MKQVVLVYVLDKKGNPLMPTKRYGHVRMLLNEHKAVVVSDNPFTIRLKYDTEGRTQQVVVGIDPGRTNIGVSALVGDEEVYSAHITTRNKEIPKLMDKRKQQRRASRMGERKARQRLAKRNETTFKDAEIHERIIPGCEKPIQNHFINNTEARFRNRIRPAGWLTPTATQLVRTHISAVNKVCKILPVTDVVMEYNKFAFMRMEHGAVWGLDFQNGRMKGYKSAKDYVSAQQGGKCFFCDDPIWDDHHIVLRSDGGSDRPENLIGVCRHCHELYHKNKLSQEQTAKLENMGEKKQWAALSVLNQTVPYVLKNLIDQFGDDRVHICAGYDTKTVRETANLAKTHNVDAACIAATCNDVLPKLCNKVYEIQQFRRHDRTIIKCQTERTYKLGDKAVAKNRKPRFKQKGDSLESYLSKLPESERRKVCSKLTVKKSSRKYNNPKRPYLPGCIFYYKGKRYVMTGQQNNGYYLTANGGPISRFPEKDCKVIKTGGLVYLN